MAKAKVVLFDIDNTLATSGGAGRRALERAVCEATGAEAPLPRVAFAGRTDPTILDDLLAAIGLRGGEPLAARILERYVRLLEDELRDGGMGRVLPGVVALLDALDARAHVHQGVLTGNIARGARLKLAAHGLERRFAFGAYGDDARRREDLLPVALARWRAARGLDVAPGDVVVVGDTVNDVAVARAHGAFAVAVGTGAPHQDREALLAAAPDLFLEDLAAASPLLDRLS